jgi:S-methylmethionine-dependent homocysteine/selenocysteine methylase
MSAQYNGTALGHGIAARLAHGPLLLDGATGTELERRGVRSTLPLWSSFGLVDAPEVVLAIHRDYVAAGADALTANTFRTQRRVLERTGAGDPGALTARAVGLARRAAAESDRPILVLGSQPPLEDCYEPTRTPPDDALAREHAEHARHLVAAGVDAVLVETMHTQREAVAAARAVRDAGGVPWVSFVCWNGPRLLSGEPLDEALDAVAAFEPVCLGVNCLPATNVRACIPALAAARAPFSVYANLGEPDLVTGFARERCDAPAGFAKELAGWLESGARAVGGCCGTTPAHIAACAALSALRPRPSRQAAPRALEGPS